MLPAGSETLARWRETGEWWANEPQREFVRWVDADGIRREDVLELPPLARTRWSVDELEDRLAPDTNFREEWNLRIHKRRDEKVAQACGLLPAEPAIPRPARSAAQPYVPLQMLSGYSLGRGTMLAEEIPLVCAGAGLPAACLADEFSLTGAVEFVKRAKAAGIKPLIGATLEGEDGGRFVLIARSRTGYEQLSQLITACHLEEPRLFPLCRTQRLQRYSRDLICLTGGLDGTIARLIVARRYDEARQHLESCVDLYGRANVAVQIERSYQPWEIAANRRLLELAEAMDVRAVASGPVTHARAEHFPVQDILCCIETLCLVDEIEGRKPRRHPSQPPIPSPGPQRALNAERYLRTPAEMAELFADRPDLLRNTVELAERCEDDVLPSRTRLPQMYADPGHVLREATYASAFQRHRTIPPKLRRQLDTELDRIIRLNFADHFLAIWDACNWARDQGILFSGRGSMVDAAISYCLGLSRIDGFRHNLHFDRFLPEDGSKRPDIDIDFEASRREDVRTYLTQRYGVERVATVAAVGTYCSRGIVREVGKAMGLPTETIGYLAKRLHGGVTPEKLESALLHRPELAGSSIPKERFRWVFELAERLQDVPRNLRSHSSGVVISSRPISETVPVQWSATEIELDGDDARRPAQLRILQWDKRSAKHYFDKFDILCLRGQDVLSGTQRRIRVSDARFEVEQLPLDDADTYRAMRSGELIGIPQSASPAMRQAHIRIRTENLHDASLVQAGIRPGVGGAVKINELIARRRGKPFEFEHPDLEGILGITYGIVVFQEQIDQLLQTFAGYSSGEAEDTREGIHKYRRQDFGGSIQDEVVARILANGYDEGVAQHVYRLVSEFKGYGFAQGHALAFAEISIRSIYCQQNYPAAYFAALLDAQPAGYYGPCTLVNEARLRGVAILRPCVDRSEEKFAVESVLSAMDPKIQLPDAGVRVSLAQISGLSKDTRRRIVSQRPRDGYQDFFEFAACVRPERDELERLILCGALDGLCPNRRAMLWAIPCAHSYSETRSSGIVRHMGAVVQEPLAFGYSSPCLDLAIEDFSLPEKAIFEREILQLDVDRHLVAFERDRIRSKGGFTCAEIRQMPGGVRCMAVGNPIRLRFPPTPSGKRVVFFDLEDESGLLNVTCFDDTYRRDGHSIVCSPYVTLVGETQDRDGHTAFLAQRVFPYRPTLASVVDPTRALPLRTADFLVG